MTKKRLCRLQRLLSGHVDVGDVSGVSRYFNQQGDRSGSVSRGTADFDVWTTTTAVQLSLVQAFFLVGREAVVRVIETRLTRPESIQVLHRRLDDLCHGLLRKESLMSCEHHIMVPQELCQSWILDLACRPVLEEVLSLVLVDIHSDASEDTSAETL